VTALRSGKATHQGQVRSNNQDTFLVVEDTNLFAVADGMGGHQGGEVASQVAVDALAEHMGGTTDSLVQAVRRANQAVYDRAGENPELRGMGTTLCALALVREEDREYIAVVNVGDSRVYLMQSGEMMQLTDDHSLVEDLVRQGRLTPEEARIHPQKNILTRALGNEPDVQVDSWEVVPYTGDRYVLCSDGLFNEVDDARIAATIRKLSDPEEAASELVRLANEGGGRDNITVVVVDVVDDDGQAAAASAALADDTSALDADGSTGAAAPASAPEADRSPRRTDGGTGERAPSGTRGADDDGLRPRRFTWRVGVFLLAVIALVGGAVGFTVWYARSAYYVGLDDDRVAIYQGRPGGVLWMNPTLEERTDLTVDDVPRNRVGDLESGHEVADRAAADRYIDNLRDEVDAQQRRSGTTTTTTAAPPPPPPPDPNQPPPQPTP
jgi:PPM family protein phosphatase